MKFKLLVASAFIGMSLGAFAQENSTPEERKGWAEISHQLEKSPTDPALTDKAEKAVLRIIEVKDFHVALCASFFNQYKGSKYKYHGEIMRLYLLGVSAYQIDSGDMENNHANYYAAESVLKGYQSILAIDPKAHDKSLDKMLTAQTEGKLKDLVGSSCK